MTKIAVLIVLVAALLVGAGCKSSSGSREFAPGQGWKLND